MPEIIDELLYLAGGVVTAKVTKILAEKYADPDTKLSIASLKGFKKPSVYLHAASGALATGYAVNQAQKFRRLSEEEYFVAGYGLTALLDSLVTGFGFAPTTVTVSPATARMGNSAIRVISPGGTVGTQTRVSGYPEAMDGGLRGMV